MNARRGDGRCATTHINGTRATHARKENSKSGKERIRSIAVAAAAAHSTRVGNCIRVKFIKAAEKIIFAAAIHPDCDWSNRRNLTQKDRKRHRQSDKFR